jgi:hypothetical protein
VVECAKHSMESSLQAVPQVCVCNGQDNSGWGYLKLQQVSQECAPSLSRTLELVLA